MYDNSNMPWEDNDSEIIDPELESLPPRSRHRVILRERARNYITGDGLFVHGTGYDKDGPLASVIDTFRTWFHFPDAGPICAGLGVIAGHLMPGAPVWLMLVGQASCGKTEVVVSTSDLMDIVPMRLVSSIRESSMLSGTPNRDKAKDSKGGIMKDLEPHGVLLMKDFTSVLQMNREERGKAVAALREVYDGEWDRPVGSDGGKSLHWKGKCSVLGGCTFALDNYQALMVEMGERFLYYRFPMVNGYAQSDMAIRNAPFHEEIQKSTKAAVKDLFQSIKIPAQLPAMESEDRFRLTAQSNLIGLFRTPVQRDQRSSQICGVSIQEAPGRASKSLTQLYQGMLVVGVHREEAWRIISKITLDCMPAVRLMLMKAFYDGGMEGSSMDLLASTLNYPVMGIRHGLEDLEALGLVVREKDTKVHKWSMSGFAKAEFRCAFPPCVE